MHPDDRGRVEEALAAAAKGEMLVHGSFEALEILRVEAGLPALGSELDEEVLPPEARLERAISTSKGCYVGQEIVARLRARGQVNHLLVGLRLESPLLPDVGTKLSVDGRTTGELTSVVLSPSEGPIALGYVRREHAEVGTQIEIAGQRARIAALPFVEGLPVAEILTSGVT
jgi:aminomethyltransferase